MNGHIIIGRPRSGKSTFVKLLLSKFKAKKIVYDVNNEYKAFYKGEFIPFDEFCELVVNENNAMIVFEEATAFFSNRGTNKQVNKMLVRRRHQNNYIVFCFHSWRQVPRFVLDLVNYVTIFKTNDPENKVSEKTDDDRILDAFNKVQNSSNEHEKITIKIY